MSVLEKANLLMARERPSDAEKELRNWLAQNPDDDRALAFLARALMDQNKLVAALQASKDAISIDPHDAFNLMILAQVYMVKGDNDSAMTALRSAIELEPEDDHLHYLKAAVELNKHAHIDALESISKALQINPEDDDYLSLRANILNQMNRASEAAETVESSLKINPDNASAHTQMGWAKLRDNQVKLALESFTEALRLDPGNESAKAGIVQALKAKLPVYRWILNFFFRLQSMPPKARWGIILGLYFGSRILRSAGHNIPAAQPVVYGLLGIYVCFVFLTWTASPLCNLFLRVHPIGKHALDADEKIASNWVGGLLLACAAMAVGGIALNIPNLIGGALGGLLFMIPLAGLFGNPPGPQRIKVGLFVAAIGFCGIYSLVSSFRKESNVEFLTIYLLGCFLYSWVQVFISNRA
ncbi:tetratricopeptide repeat protein [Pontiellaceae bacterium B1224]|nr:tetratricopeptide repeat protein [Pontiellaceae bacterium B1224]